MRVGHSSVCSRHCADDSQDVKRRFGKFSVDSKLHAKELEMLKWLQKAVLDAFGARVV